MTNTCSVEDELLDVVDHQDQAVRAEKRGVIHFHKFRHRAVHILIYNRAGQVFLQRRAKTKDTFPDRWDSSCSGHVDTGEDYLESALRELKEELGIMGVGAEFITPLFKIDACPQTGSEFVWVYRAQHEGPFTLNPDEISRGEFFDAKEVSRLISASPEQFAPAFTHLWRRL